MPFKSRRCAFIVLPALVALLLRSLPLGLPCSLQGRNYVASARKVHPSVATLALSSRYAISPNWGNDVIRFESGAVSCNLGVTRAGSGPPVLLLPALSSISTRGEMLGLQAFLAASGFEAISVDWPGLGDTAKPSVSWSPDLYEAFLLWVLSEVVPSPVCVVAAGHAAGYLLRVAEKAPTSFGRAVLVAPTWRGPVPTMLRGRRPRWLGVIRALVDLPFIGSLFYKMNLNDFVIRLMARRHVYSEPDWLDSNATRMSSKRLVAQARGARHASIRFVTGALDPYQSADAFVNAAAAIGDRVLVLLGAEMPGRSMAEVDKLSEVLARPPVILPRGRLNIHEEFPEEVADVIIKFMREWVV